MVREDCTHEHKRLTRVPRMYNPLIRTAINESMVCTNANSEREQAAECIIRPKAQEDTHGRHDEQAIIKLSKWRFPIPVHMHYFKYKQKDLGVELCFELNKFVATRRRIFSITNLLSHFLPACGAG